MAMMPGRQAGWLAGWLAFIILRHFIFEGAKAGCVRAPSSFV